MSIISYLICSLYLIFLIYGLCIVVKATLEEATHTTLSFLTYDKWVGIFDDKKKNIKYVCLLPMIVIKIERTT